MQVAIDAPRRPALRYYGGKWRLAPWILSFFPEHKNYVEPCGGAASVLLQKPRSPLETYNDIDGRVVEFFRVLRDCPMELIRWIQLTPWARDEYDNCRQDCDDPLERARRFWVWAWMGIGGRYGGWRTCTTVDSVSRTWPSDSINIEHLMIVAQRFMGVQIENIDWRECVQKYDNSNALIYLDPPYVIQQRERGGRYDFEWDEGDHIEAADILNAVDGCVVISGYACDLYRELYEARGWVRYDRAAQTNGRQMTESVWLSPRTADAMLRARQSSFLMEICDVD